MMSLDALLDDLAGYIGKPETSCFSLPPDAYLSPDLHDAEISGIFCLPSAPLGQIEWFS